MGIYSDHENFNFESNFESDSSYNPLNQYNDIPSSCSTPNSQTLEGIFSWNLEGTSTSDQQHVISTRRKKLTKRMDTPLRTRIHKKLFESEFTQGNVY